MEQSLRKLQIFRNGELLTGSVAEVKDRINQALGKDITLKDGEPISIRYRVKENGEIKSLFGVAYVPTEGTPSILWTPNQSDLVLDTNGDDYVTLDYILDESTGNYTLTVGAKTKSVYDAKSAEGETPAVDGLATALDVKNYVTEQIGSIKIPEYTIQETTTTDTIEHLKSYQLFKDGVAVDGSIIDIPKDYLVKSASLETVTVVDNPQVGFEVGDKYIDFVINTKEDNGTEKHLYINVSDLVDVYTQGNGISIEGNKISVKITENEKYIAVDGDGIHTNVQTIADATKESNGLATALDVKEYVDNYDCGTFNLTDNNSGSTEQ